ncbi:MULTISPECIES: YqjK family protein [unclassified Undibacterium]|uniref:YqjK family protein n=1 Tax=unclassified Undibacterium TaxID=2630295 RepID=UPI002AC99C36|nr:MULTISPECIES: YqjK family protein [unclassified Undibacterium]MEB0137954.1 YqjK family protein [Undibacterium sp. CCC2.1]MEB0173104.1 YqjK family protein [Undibacterium sp. CCC1.1]MEB0174962.1 YqjK family protein [Undibacterium sp. CCC3.4]MEB0216130.1 YqjK family protein [Undibacterium sp. 5I2]WPX45405.1 YqjK family protein [Undibacterium sp. CCC3.4]
MAYENEVLALRRQALLVKIHAQRCLLGLQTEQLSHSFDTVDAAYTYLAKVFALIRQRPLLSASAAALLFIVKPRRLISLSTSTLTAWQIWRRLSPLLKQWQARSDHTPTK